MSFLSDLTDVAKSWVESLNPIKIGLDIWSSNRQMHFADDQRKASEYFNAEEAQKARDFQHQERLDMQQYQTQEWQRQFDAANEYNTPANQAARLRQAGLNPAVYFGGSGTVVGASAPSTPSAPSSSAPSASVSPGAGVQLPSFLSDPSQAALNMANARKAMAETNTIDLMRDPQYQEMLSRIYGQNLANESLKLANAFDRATFGKRTEKIAMEVMELAAQVRLADTKDDLMQSETLLNRAYERLQHNLADKAGFEALIAKNELASWHQTYQMMLQEKRSEIAKNYASAEESKAVADNQLSMSDKTRLEKIIMQNTQSGIEERVYYEVENLKKEGKILDAQERQVLAAAKEAEVAADHAEVLFWKNFIIDIIAEGSNAIVGFKNAKSWRNMSESSQKRVESKMREIDLLEEDIKGRHGDTHEDTYIRYDAQGRKHTIKDKYNRSGQRYKGKY